MEAYRNLPVDGAPPRQVAEAVNLILQGKINALAEVTLRANQTTTVLIDERISAQSWIGLVPLTANAAGALATTYPSARSKGTATITHANAATTDRQFLALLIG